MLAAGNSMYVLGGTDAADEALADVERFDVSEGVWVPVAPMNCPRSSFSAVLVRGACRSSVGECGVVSGRVPYWCLVDKLQATPR